MACPEREVLSSWTAGSLTEEEESVIATHVDACPSCAGVLSTLAPASPGTSELAAGSMVGRFVIEGRIGAGAMGVVYEAHDPQLGRRVAVKLLRDRLPRPRARARLLDEARAMARLAHPNVVVVFDSGTVGEQVFVAMELISGRSLADWLATRPSFREVLDAFLQAGRGLAAAHAVGIVHRDFKPANVLVGADGRVRVSDFGLARVAGAAAEPSEGTPAYMAPEQRAGADSSPLSDQYSFCVALYEGLYGERPRGGPAPRRPIPAALRRICQRGLKPRPEDRWPDMPALLGALGRAGNRRRAAWAAGAGALVATAVAALVFTRGVGPPPCTGIESRLFGIWDPAQKAALHRAFLATQAAGAEGRWQSVERLVDAYGAAWVAKSKDVCAATEIRHEQPPAAEARRQACLDQRLENLGAWVGAFRAPDAQMVKNAPSSAAARESIAACDDLTAAAWPMPADPALLVEVRKMRARITALRAKGDAGDIKLALDGWERLREDARALGYKPVEGEALQAAGEILYNLGEVERAEKSLKEALALGEETRHDLLRAGVWTDLVWLYDLKSKPERAHEAARYAEAVLKPMSGADAEFIRSSLEGNEASAFVAEHKLDEALRLQHAGRARAEALLGPDDVKLAPDLMGEADILATLRRDDDAELLYRRALANVRAVSGDDHPMVPEILANMAGMYQERGDYAEALEMRLEAQAGMEIVFGPAHLFTAENLVNVAHDLILLGRAAEALPKLEQARSVIESKLGARNPVMAEVLATLGQAELERGQPARALAPLEEALAMKVEVDASAESIADVRFNLARSLFRVGTDRRRARELAVKARAGLDENHAGERAAVDAWLAESYGR